MKVTKRIVVSTRDTMSGTPVFAGTRVPVKTLIEYLEGGSSIDDFLDGFPTVKRKQVLAFLDAMKKRLVADEAPAR